MAKKIGFTYDLREDHEQKNDQPSDALAEFDRKETIDSVVEALESGGYTVVRIGNVRGLLRMVDSLDVDIVLNICEGVGNRNRESEVPTILDLYNIPFVGSDGLTCGLTLDKAMAKKAFVADGVPTPKYFVADPKTDLSHLDSMKFPFIVKPKNEGSSKGISEDSIVNDRKALKAQIEEVSRAYRQPALVEEFISGSEFTVLVIGNEAPEALVPVQIQITGLLELGELIYTSRRLDNTDIAYICPPKISEKLQRELCDIAVRAYRATDCRDFARVDFRVDEKGHPYVLEVNPLPSLSTEDVFPLIAQAAGMSYGTLILKIVDIALKRYGLDEKHDRLLA